MTQRLREKLRISFLIISLSILFGALYGFLVTGYSVLGLPRGALTGALISTPIILFELFYVRDKKGERLRRSPLWIFVLIKAIAYSIAIIGGEIGAQFLFEALFRFQTTPRLESLLLTFLFSFAAGLGINFLFLMQQMLGPRTFGHLILGRYHRPRKEELIFLFVDLKDSTGIAERIGAVEFHTFTNRFIYAITGPILEHCGSIYRYVGDEVIATWPLASAKENARSLNCLGDIQDIVTQSAPKFEREFGELPSFRAALHAGTVVAGEMGDWRREITYMGDVVNTTARIESACKALNQDILISADLLKQTDVPADIEATSVGPVALAGKAEKMELYKLEWPRR